MIAFIASSSLNSNAEFSHAPLHGIDSATFAKHNADRSLPDHIPAEREKFGGILDAAVFKPAGNDAGLDLEERVSDDNLPVGRNSMAGELRRTSFERPVELIILEAGVDAAVESQGAPSPCLPWARCRRVRR